MARYFTFHFYRVKLIEIMGLEIIFDAKATNASVYTKDIIHFGKWSDILLKIV